jgi:trk system potassium uptake protein TrkH
VKQAVILRVLILLLGVAALTMILPLVLAALYGEDEMIRPFLIPISMVLMAALPLAVFTRKARIRFSATDGFLLVFLAWVLICLLGALPYYAAGRISRFSDAVFESVSGFTTTGATIIEDVESMPRSLLFWRAMTHWLGGMGIVVLTVALLPLLGIGGSQLLRAETPGPEKDAKVTPKITAAAKLLWLLYCVLTGVEALLLRIGGMGWFDAVTHAFSTMATGGFSTRNAGIAAYGSPWIEWVCTVFMILAGFNFTLILKALRGKFRDVRDNSEARGYVFIILLAAGLIIFSRYSRTGFIPGTLEPAAREAFFHTASILSTTGFSAAEYGLWPPLAKAALFCLMFIGGCSGSTAGGVKVIRHVVLWKQAGNEMKRLIYPRGVFTIRLNKKVGRKDVVYGVTGFVFFYAALILGAALLVSASGPDLFSSLNAAVLALGNIGLGFGTGGSVLRDLPGYAKWGLSFVMIAGRLELWTAFVFFSRDYWRR